MKPVPPSLMVRLLRWFCREDLLEEIEGDLTEIFNRTCRQNPSRARRQFTWSVLRYFRPAFIKPFKLSVHTTSKAMYRNYLKSAWRSLLVNKTFSFIKISGLSLGLTVCMLIFLYSKDELSYDRFHKNKSQLYRIIQHFTFSNAEPQTLGTTNAILGNSFKENIPEVAQCVHVNGAPVTVQKSDNEFITENPLFVDENFFTVFSFPLTEGNSSTALKELYSIVLSEEMAMKYFGRVNVSGNILRVKINEAFENFRITAVARNAPQNSTIKAGLYLPFKSYERFNDNQDWFGGSVNSFLLLTPQATVKVVEAKMQALYNKHTKEKFEQIRQQKDMNIRVSLSLQPLIAIHLSNEAGPDNGLTDGSNPIYPTLLGFIAFFILVVACINFINLAVAESLRRSKEVGIRKVAGSSRRQLISQFLAESFLFSFLAFLLAVALTIAMLPFFNQLSNKRLSFPYLADGYFFLVLAVLLLFTALLAGFYPAVVLSSFKPAKVLYGRIKMTGKNYFTKVLVVLQFSLAAFLIICTIGINTQLNYLSGADLGYNGANLVRISIPVRKSSDGIPQLFRNNIAHQGTVTGITAKSSGRSITEVRAGKTKITIEKTKVDELFLPTLQIPLVAGRNFSRDYPADAMHSVLVNEAFAKQAGWAPADAIGQTVTFNSGGIQSATIAGVIKDYHFLSLKEKITPQLLTMDTNFNYGELWARIKPGTTVTALVHIQESFQKTVPYFPYSCQFIDDVNQHSYREENNWKNIISIASGLFIFIASTGLLGLVILSVQQRTREIGIRKILGAAVGEIAIIVSRQFITLILLAFAVAAPLSHLAISKWLDNFSYRKGIGVTEYLVSAGIIIGVALLTISFQAVKAALANPVKTLRT